MKCKLDENLPADAVALLREAGHDASSVYEQHLSGTGDEALFTILQREKRVLITLDLGFGDIRAYPPAEHHGVIVLRPKTQDIPHILALLRRLLTPLEMEPIQHRLWVVDHRRIRVQQ